MSTPFELPIYYLENKEPLDENIKTDLELLEVNQDSESRKSLLQTVMNPQSKIGNQFQVVTHEGTHNCVIVEKPFYDPKKKIASS